jgi:hypothetical protein
MILKTEKPSGKTGRLFNRIGYNNVYGKNPAIATGWPVRPRRYGSGMVTIRSELREGDKG